MPDILISNSTGKIVSRSILVDLGTAHTCEKQTQTISAAATTVCQLRMLLQVFDAQLVLNI